MTFSTSVAPLHGGRINSSHLQPYIVNGTATIESFSILYWEANGTTIGGSPTLRVLAEASDNQGVGNRELDSMAEAVEQVVVLLILEGPISGEEHVFVAATENSLANTDRLFLRHPSDTCAGQLTRVHTSLALTSTVVEGVFIGFDDERRPANVDLFAFILLGLLACCWCAYLGWLRPRRRRQKRAKKADAARAKLQEWQSFLSVTQSQPHSDDARLVALIKGGLPAKLPCHQEMVLDESEQDHVMLAMELFDYVLDHGGPVAPSGVGGVRLLPPKLTSISVGLAASEILCDEPGPLTLSYQTVAATDHEMIELLEVYLVLHHAPLRTGYSGGFGVRAPPPKLLPFQEPPTATELLGHDLDPKLSVVDWSVGDDAADTRVRVRPPKLLPVPYEFEEVVGSEPSDWEWHIPELSAEVIRLACTDFESHRGFPPRRERDGVALLYSYYDLVNFDLGKVPAVIFEATSCLWKDGSESDANSQLLLRMLESKLEWCERSDRGRGRVDLSLLPPVLASLCVQLSVETDGTPEETAAQLQQHLKASRGSGGVYDLSSLSASILLAAFFLDGMEPAEAQARLQKLRSSLEGAAAVPEAVLELGRGLFVAMAGLDAEPPSDHDVVVLLRTYLDDAASLPPYVVNTAGLLPVVHAAATAAKEQSAFPSTSPFSEQLRILKIQIEAYLRANALIDDDEEDGFGIRSPTDYPDEPGSWPVRLCPPKLLPVELSAEEQGTMENVFNRRFGIVAASEHENIEMLGLMLLERPRPASKLMNLKMGIVEFDREDQLSMSDLDENFQLPLARVKPPHLLPVSVRSKQPLPDPEAVAADTDEEVRRVMEERRARMLELVGRMAVVEALADGHRRELLRDPEAVQRAIIAFDRRTALDDEQEVCGLSGLPCLCCGPHRKHSRIAPEADRKLSRDQVGSTRGAAIARDHPVPRLGALPRMVLSSLMAIEANKDYGNPLSMEDDSTWRPPRPGSKLVSNGTARKHRVGGLYHGEELSQRRPRHRGPTSSSEMSVGLKRGASATRLAPVLTPTLDWEDGARLARSQRMAGKWYLRSSEAKVATQTLQLQLSPACAPEHHQSGVVARPMSGHLACTDERRNTKESAHKRFVYSAGTVEEGGDTLAQVWTSAKSERPNLPPPKRSCPHSSAKHRNAKPTRQINSPLSLAQPQHKPTQSRAAPTLKKSPLSGSGTRMAPTLQGGALRCAPSLSDSSRAVVQGGSRCTDGSALEALHDTSLDGWHDDVEAEVSSPVLAVAHSCSSAGAAEATKISAATRVQAAARGWLVRSHGLTRSTTAWVQSAAPSRRADTSLITGCRRSRSASDHQGAGSPLVVVESSARSVKPLVLHETELLAGFAGGGGIQLGLPELKPPRRLSLQNSCRRVSSCRSLSTTSTLHDMATDDAFNDISSDVGPAVSRPRVALVPDALNPDTVITSAACRPDAPAPPRPGSVGAVLSRRPAQRRKEPPARNPPPLPSRGPLLDSFTPPMPPSRKPPSLPSKKQTESGLASAADDSSWTESGLAFLIDTSSNVKQHRARQ